MDNEENMEVETLDDVSDNDETSKLETEDQPEEEIDPTDPIEDMIANIEKGEFVSANDVFNSMLNDKMADALENEKISIASRLYNKSEPEAEVEQGTEEELEYDEAV